MNAEFVASRDPGLIAAGVIMYALIGILLLAAAFYLVWLSVHRPATSKAHFLKGAEDAHAVEVRLRPPLVPMGTGNFTLRDFLTS